jgi:fluoroquinolone transport system ATP-binding protein
MIKVESLDFRYHKSDRLVLKNVSFDVKNGEIFGFLGPSGAGKSTTQKVLNGILKNFSGKVLVNGQDVSKAGKGFYETIGVAFEFPHLYLKLTAFENLSLFASFYNSKTEDPMRLLEMVGLAGERNIRVEAFSKGMRMRLNFVRSLLNHPQVLFLDEPTSGLDPINARKMKDIILGLKEKGVTVFLTTHNMADADELCDRLAFMIDGQLMVVDSPRALKLKNGKKKIRISYQDQKRVVYQEFELNGLGANPLFMEIIKNKEIETLHTQEATLEDVFIKITGQALV